jgi:hypothetical protein
VLGASSGHRTTTARATTARGTVMGASGCRSKCPPGSQSTPSQSTAPRCASSRQWRGSRSSQVAPSVRTTSALDLRSGRDARSGRSRRRSIARRPSLVAGVPGSRAAGACGGGDPGEPRPPGGNLPRRTSAAAGRGRARRSLPSDRLSRRRCANPAQLLPERPDRDVQHVPGHLQPRLGDRHLGSDPEGHRGGSRLTSAQRCSAGACC